MNVYEVRCAGCGSCVATLDGSGAPGEAQELLASVQANPPICVVCSFRLLASPRPEVQLWERVAEAAVISGLAHSEFIDGPLHDEVSY